VRKNEPDWVSPKSRLLIAPFPARLSAQIFGEGELPGGKYKATPCQPSFANLTHLMFAFSWSDGSSSCDATFTPFQHFSENSFFPL
jgi:hypothetical protein